MEHEHLPVMNIMDTMSSIESMGIMDMVRIS
jgi:hypothetical protein